MIYYYDNTLIVALELQPLEEYRLLGLDAKTGEEKWRIENGNFMYIQDPVTGYLYDIGGKIFNVIDARKGKVIYKGDMTDENKRFNVIPERGVLGENGIYFLDNFPRSKVGLINLQTHQIEFVQDLGLADGVKVTKLSYHNDRLYVLDTMSVLHIWAK